MSREGLTRLGGRSHCKHSSLTNKVLLLMINGNEWKSECVCVCVCVCVCLGREKDNEDDGGDE